MTWSRDEWTFAVRWQACSWQLPRSHGASAETHTIVQMDRSFNPNEITIAAGDSLAFSNQDEFIHQIYVDFRSRSTMIRRNSRPGK